MSRTRSLCAWVALLVACLFLDSMQAQAEDDETLPRPVLTAQLGHADTVTSVAFSPAGTHVLTGSSDATARLWEMETGREVHRFDWHRFGVSSVAFSPDGTHLLTGSADGTVCLWETATGRCVRCFGYGAGVSSVAFSPDGAHFLMVRGGATVFLRETATGVVVRRFEGHGSKVSSVVFSPDGKHVVTGSDDATVRLWETASGEEVRRFEGHGSRVSSVAFSPEGTHVLTGSGDTTARLWDTATGQELRHYDGHGEVVTSVAFSPDGMHVLTGSDDATVRLWEAATGEEVRRFEGHGASVSLVAFSPDGAHVLTGSWDQTVRLWETATGEEVRRFEGHGASVSSVAFSSDGAYVLTGLLDATACLWETATGGSVCRFEGHGGGVRSAAVSPDGTHVLTAAWDDATARLWEASSGEEVRRFEGHRDQVSSVAYSPNGAHVLTGSDDATARLWKTASGEEVRHFGGHGASVSSVAFSPDGAHVLTGSSDATARLWETTTGTEVRRFEGHGASVSSVAFSPDGAYVLTGSYDATARLWETSTGREVRSFAGHVFWVVSCVAFSHDGTHLLTGSSDGTACLWETATGRDVRRFEGHGAEVSSVAFSPDGACVLTGSHDATVRLWETETGRELSSLVSFRDGTWAVLDYAGRYDASNGGNVAGLHWVTGLEAIALDQLKDRYYDPGLLAKHMGLSEEPLRDVAAFDSVKIFPQVEVEPPGADSLRVGIHLRNRGGGIGRVVVLVNGKEVEADARGGAVRPDQSEATLEVDLTADPRVRPGETNTVQVFAYNAEGYLRSRGPLIPWTARGEKTVDPPHLWAVVCGVSDYRTDAIDLRYADKDAEDFAAALRLAAGGLFGDERVHLTLLSTSGAEGTRRPTRANLELAFQTAKEAGPDDLLVIYLSGHGVNVGGQDGDYHYLLAEAASADLTDPAVRNATSVSSAELTGWINDIPASKRLVLILDTCASGKVIEELTEARNVPGSQVRALDRLKDRTGMFVLAGCASDKVSYEATRYGQGLLTYSLLLGMRGGALRDDEYVDVQKLLGFAADQVPALAKDIGGIQRPVVAQPKGGATFDLGRLPVGVRDQIPLEAVKPVFVRTTFIEDKRRRDTLSVGAALDEALRDLAARGGRAPVVFVDTRQMPEAHELSGGYVIEGDAVRVTAVLWHGDTEVATFEVTGDRTDVPALAAKIVVEAQKRLP